MTLIHKHRHVVHRFLLLLALTGADQSFEASQAGPGRGCLAPTPKGMCVNQRKFSPKAPCVRKARIGRQNTQSRVETSALIIRSCTRTPIRTYSAAEGGDGRNRCVAEPGAMNTEELPPPLLIPQPPLLLPWPPSSRVRDMSDERAAVEQEQAPLYAPPPLRICYSKHPLYTQKTSVS